MKKKIMCLVFVLLGMGSIICGAFLSARGTGLFWVILLYSLGGCLMISPFNPLFTFGLCLTMAFGALFIAGGYWLMMSGMSSLNPLLISLCVSGAGAICALFPFGVGTLMEVLGGIENEQWESIATPLFTAIGVASAVVLGLIARFGIYPLLAMILRFIFK